MTLRPVMHLHGLYTSTLEGREPQEAVHLYRVLQAYHQTKESSCCHDDSDTHAWLIPPSFKSLLHLPLQEIGQHAGWMSVYVNRNMVKRRGKRPKAIPMYMKDQLYLLIFPLSGRISPLLSLSGPNRNLTFFATKSGLRVRAVVCI